MLTKTQERPKIIRSALIAAALLAWILSASGCGMMPGWLEGERAAMNLDGGDAFEAAMDVGEDLTLTMPRPADERDELVGAAFDPKVLDLAGFLLQPGEGAGDRGRAVYIFRALAPGETAVQIRIRRSGKANGTPEVYKTVKVSVDD